MGTVDSLVTDRDEYLAIRSRGAATFDLEARLPAQVFRTPRPDALFCEFDVVLTPEFWPALCAMARWHGDEQVELLVLEPEADEFYLPEYRLYPAVSLPVESSMDDYWAVIGHEPNGEALGSIAISADVIAVTGPSGAWGCWGERNPEVAVFQGFPSEAARAEWSAEFGPFLDVSGALDSYLPLTFAGRSVPAEYAATLTSNYGGGKR
ncbi:hypothetical protein [Amycolatopsis magusensis]|uniref:hypothetical protein n=1 Tax=Amycolatopsis magusensis TaxID=882444 RepID=UPI0024A8686C|nr:hypothetical protein [Amycolatopsis magusensis]MDI5976148.1 hypothetical protein [Amycolatopsis magusensis]